ncbi:MAG: RNA polymerase sigma factor [Bacillota bacterium]
MANDFLRLYESCYDDIYRYVYCKTGNPWDTDDIVSDVFLKAYRHYDSTRQTHKAWLVTIARNTTVDYYRKSGRELPGEVPESLTFMTVLEDLEHDLEKACLKSALSQLDDEQFELINLRFFCGLKFREIASVLGTKQANVKTRFYRTLEQLRKKVESCLASENS